MNPPGLSQPWLLEPVVTALAAVAALCFARGFVRLRRRGRADHAPWTRAALFALGLALMVLPLVSPLDELADRYLLSAHMLQHMLIGDAGPALILVALRGPLLLFVIPTAVLTTVGHSGRVRTAAAWLARPAVAVAIWAVAFGVWHIPAIYDYAATHQAAHDLEHASFVFAGFVVWAVLIDPTGHGRVSRGRRLAVIAALLAIGTVIADILIFSLTPLYSTYADQPHRAFGLTPLRDQQLAGLVMTAEQLLALGTCAAILLAPELRRRRRAKRPPLAARQPA
ncbi:MAG TPA: cytochrome c oxidase assembly protein [Gaiellaceae bacterium]|nr:cytochrome c oxidase assembly protein [Gaiellaceae bacterium]